MTGTYLSSGLKAWGLIFFLVWDVQLTRLNSRTRATYLVWCFGFHVLNHADRSWFGIWGLGFEVLTGFGIGVWGGSGFRVWGLGFGIWGLGLEVWGFEWGGGVGD